MLICFVVGCQPYGTDEIAGTWRGASVLEEGKVLDIDASQIEIAFTAAGGYEFLSTLNYRESGMFRLEGDLLFTKDTLVEKAIEKAVRITALSVDSLVLKMNEQGRERILHLYKTPE